MNKPEIIKKLLKLKKKETCSCQEWRHHPPTCDGIYQNKIYNSCLKDIIEIIKEDK